MSKRIVWSSTTLGKIQRHCLAVVCYDEPDDRRIFEAGKVAHLIAERVQTATNNRAEADIKAKRIPGPLPLTEISDIAAESVTVACEHGFSFLGRPEPPPRPDNAERGRFLAERWLHERPPEPGMDAEVGVFMDRWGKRVSRDDPKVWARVIIDAVGLSEIEIEDELRTVLRARDFKSDWQSGKGRSQEGEVLVLDNIQRWLQGLGAWALYEDDEFEGMLLEVDSMPRTWRYERLVMGTEMGILDQWRESIQAITDGYDARIRRHGKDPEKLASPGAGCMGCPHLGECKPGRRHLKRISADAPLEEIARTYAVHVAEVERLKYLLKQPCDELGEIITGDTSVGYEDEVETIISPDAAAVVWREWKRMPREGVDDAQDAFEADLIARYLGGVVLTSTTLKTLLARLWPMNRGKAKEREEKKKIRDRIWEEVARTRFTAKFGVRKVAPPEPSIEEQLKASIELAKGEV